MTATRLTVLHGVSDAGWTINDRRWFKRHPHRTHRLRRAAPDEDVAGRTWVIVRQLEPGKLSRIATFFSDDFQEIITSIETNDDVWDGLARALFDTISDALDRGSEVFPQDLVARINLLAMDGRA